MQHRSMHVQQGESCSWLGKGDDSRGRQTSGGFSSRGLLGQRNGAPLLLVYTIHNSFREAALDGRQAVFSLYAHGIPDNATTLTKISPRIDLTDRNEYVILSAKRLANRFAETTRNDLLWRPLGVIYHAPTGE